MRQTQSQVPEALTDRGIGWQAAGFTLTGILCLVILKTYDGSDYWLYQWFETATVDLYWSFLLPLAALFDGAENCLSEGRPSGKLKRPEWWRKPVERPERRPGKKKTSALRSSWNRTA
jgi:hypothetical protein